MTLSRRALDELWQVDSDSSVFDSQKMPSFPPAVQRYFRHAIAPGTVLAKAVRLRMHGDIKLGRWVPFTAEEVIRWDRGFIWRACVRMHGISIQGSDSFLDGKGQMRWNLLGILPMIRSAGVDIDRSAAGRLNIEAVWLPSILYSNQVDWTETDATHIRAEFFAHGQQAMLDLTINDAGSLRSIVMPRWGSLDKRYFKWMNFGGSVREDKTFHGYTIPTRLQLGWHFRNDCFESDGEFFRATIETAEFV